MRIGIVVINWNGLELLKKYLKVLIQNSVNHNIYLIDNNSEDESVSYVRNNYSEVNIINLDKNYGFAEGYNRGILKVNEEFICIINNDIEVTKDWLKPVEKKLNNSPNIIIQPKYWILIKDPSLSMPERLVVILINMDILIVEVEYLILLRRIRINIKMEKFFGHQVHVCFYQKGFSMS